MPGRTLMALKGHAAPEVGQAYTRARELCQQMGETPQLFPVLLGLWRFYLVRGGVPDGAGAGGAMFQPGPAGPRPSAPPRSPFCARGELTRHGEVVPPRALLEQGIALYNPQEHRALAFRAGH